MPTPTPFPVSSPVGAFMQSSDKGEMMAALNVAPDNSFVFEGDSLTSPNSGADWPAQLMLLPIFSGHGTDYNVATTSDTLAGIISDYPTEVYPHRPAANAGKPAWLFVWIGTNDIGSVTTSDFLSDLSDYWQTAKDDGFTVVAMTITPANFSEAQEEQRQAINAGIRLSSAPDYLVDVAAVFSNHLDTSIYSDGLHFTAAGNIKIAALAQSQLIEWNGTAVPDVTGTTAIAGPIFIGSTVAPRAGYRLDVLQDYQGTDSNGGVQIIARWTPSGSSSNAVVAMTAQVEKRGSQYGQDAIGIAANGYLQSAVQINSISLIQTFGGNQTTSYGGANGTYLYNFNHLLARTPIADANNPIDVSSAVRIQAQKVTGVGTGFAVISEGASDISAFAGKVRVGSTVAPTYVLHVTGSCGVSTLNISSIPTSASGLSSGDVYSNVGILTIVP